MNETKILRNENLVREAQLNSDLTTLSKLLSKRLTYVHSNGYIDSYDSYLDKIQNHIIRYKKIDLIPQAIQVFDEIAIRTGIIKGHVIVLNNRKKLNNYTSNIWVKENDEWRLLQFQSTAIE